MGKYGFQLSHQWLHISDEKIKRAEQQFKRWGAPALLFAWLPIIGDPLCLVAGSLRYHFVGFVLLVSLGKLARYTLLAWAFI
jgi:membrane protein YqaA with SNARE-associated domain